MAGPPRRGREDSFGRGERHRGFDEFDRFDRGRGRSGPPNARGRLGRDSFDNGMGRGGPPRMYEEDRFGDPMERDGYSGRREDPYGRGGDDRWAEPRRESPIQSRLTPGVHSRIGSGPKAEAENQGW